MTTLVSNTVHRFLKNQIDHTTLHKNKSEFNSYSPSKMKEKLEFASSTIVFPLSNRYPRIGHFLLLLENR